MTIPQHFTLDSVPPFKKDEHADAFCEALSIAVRCQNEQMAEVSPDTAYSTLLGFTGRGWLIGFDDASYYWEKYNVDNPISNFAACSLESYFEHAGTLRDAVLFTNHAPELLWNLDCTYPVDRQQAAGLISLSQAAGAVSLRQYVIDSLLKRGRPVVALLHLPQAQAVDMVLITGYEAGGADIRVQTAHTWNSIEGTGCYDVRDWEQETLAIIGVGDAAKTEWEKNPAYLALKKALLYSAGRTQGTRHYGLAAYDAWQAALLDEDSVTGVDNAVLSRRLLYHSAVAGDIACQKIFTTMPPCAGPAMGIIDGYYSRAAVSPGIIHGLMWDAWQVVGGYWRGVKPGQPPFRYVFDNEAEVNRFRERAVRERAARVIQRARQVDEQTIQDFREAKEAWDGCLARGGEHPCPCFDRPCARMKGF